VNYKCPVFVCCFNESHKKLGKEIWNITKWQVKQWKIKLDFSNLEFKSIKIKCYNFFLQNKRNMKFNYEKGQEFHTMKHPSYCCMVGVPFYKMLAPLLCFIRYPAHTLQNLKQCFTRNKMPMLERTFHFPKCPADFYSYNTLPK
jgi:hypothetical protein